MTDGLNMGMLRDLLEAADKRGDYGFPTDEAMLAMARLERMSEAIAKALVEHHDTLSVLSSYLSNGLGDDSTSADDFEARIRDGIDRIVRVERDRVMQDLSEFVALSQKVAGPSNEAIICVAHNATEEQIECVQTWLNKARGLPPPIPCLHPSPHDAGAGCQLLSGHSGDHRNGTFTWSEKAETATCTNVMHSHDSAFNVCRDCGLPLVTSAEASGRDWCPSTMDDAPCHYRCGLDRSHLGPHVDRLGCATWDNINSPAGIGDGRVVNPRGKQTKP